jgi:hypothetical protein
LEQLCDPDPRFPFGIVSSIYYDTSNWDYLSEKRNSDYLKTKVRLRWYENIVRNNEKDDPSFAEVKYRVGSRRAKIRIPTAFSGNMLSTLPLENSALLGVPMLIKTKGVPISKPLFPTFIVRYKRRRFIERSKRIRVCLDYDISSPKLNRNMLPKAIPCKLGVAVFEVKDIMGDLPKGLHQLVNFGFQKASFSKYFTCYLRLTQTLP